jgi:hypothetical protein
VEQAFALQGRTGAEGTLRVRNKMPYGGASPKAANTGQVSRSPLAMAGMRTKPQGSAEV